MKRGGVKSIHGVAQYAHTAYFPGTGPALQTCAGCKHFIVNKTAVKKAGGAPISGRCSEWARKMRESWRFGADRQEQAERRLTTWWSGWGVIRADTPACKFFEATPERINLDAVETDAYLKELSEVAG